MATTEPIRNKDQLKDFAEYYLRQGKYRDYTLIVLGLHTALRIGDLLCLRWGDVRDAKRGRMRKSITITERKTGKTKTVALHSTALRALELLYSHTASADSQGFLFKSRNDTGRAISRVQAYRIIRAAAEAVKLEGTISCHSLRKTFGYHAWKRHVSPTVIMEIYNHSSYAVTRRYLGITQDDKDNAYLQADLL